MEILIGNLFGSLEKARQYTDHMNAFSDKIPFMKGKQSLKTCANEMESLHVYADNLNTTANHISTSDRVLLFVNFDKHIEFFFSYLRRLDVRFVASMCACIKVMKILNSLTASINRR